MSDVIRLINYVEQRLFDIREGHLDTITPNVGNNIANQLGELYDYLEKKIKKYSYSNGNRRWRVGLAMLERASLNLGQAQSRYTDMLSGDDWGHVDAVKKHLKTARYNFRKMDRYDNNPFV
jgi:hypothetical protein